MGVSLDIGSEEEPKVEKVTEPEGAAKTDTKTGAGKPSFLMYGNTAQKAINKEEAIAEARAAEQGKLWRFYIDKDDREEHSVTFLDGHLNEDEMLNIPTGYEHMIQLNGQWTTVICISHAEPCPCCDNGDNQRDVLWNILLIGGN